MSEWWVTIVKKEVVYNTVTPPGRHHYSTVSVTVRVTMPTVIHSGYLTKRGHKFPTWKRRYFEICDDGLLSYYTTQGGTKRGSFQFDEWSVIAPSSFFDNTCGFTLRGNMTCLYVKVDSEEEKVEWLHELNRILKSIKKGEIAMLKENVDDVVDVRSRRSISDVDFDNCMELSESIKCSENVQPT